jgi:hypothetical protein
VSLTTLGFGVLEALLGQIFLVTLVARLVTLWVRQAADRGESTL